MNCARKHFFLCGFLDCGGNVLGDSRVLPYENCQSRTREYWELSRLQIVRVLSVNSSLNRRSDLPDIYGLGWAGLNQGCKCPYKAPFLGANSNFDISPGTGFLRINRRTPPGGFGGRGRYLGIPGSEDPFTGIATDTQSKVSIYSK